MVHSEQLSEFRVHATINNSRLANPHCFTMNLTVLMVSRASCLNSLLCLHVGAAIAEN